MSSIKVKFRPSTMVDKEGTIYYQVIYGRKTRQLKSNYKIFESEWDEKRSMVVVGKSSERRLQILYIRQHICWDLERMSRIMRKFERNAFNYSADDLISEFIRYSEQSSLFNFMENQISKLRGNGHLRTSETYLSTLRSFRRFRCDEDIMLDSMNSDVMEAYQAWLKDMGRSQNTISFYIRILRAVYNRAVEEEIIENHYPFRHVYTGVDKTIKRALPIAIIKKIRKLDLSYSKTLDYARDLFILSFMLRGMSFVDMTFLRKSDLISGHIVYRRRKTGQQLTIAWTREMQAILDKYPQNASEYLLPIIRRSGLNERCVYRKTSYNINYSLKRIGRMLGLEKPLTLYVARHSWASAAKSKGIPLGVISEGMGHDNETTTRIYLASLDTSIVDRANALILRSI